MISLSQVRRYLHDVKEFYNMDIKKVLAIGNVPIKEYRKYIERYNILLNSAPEKLKQVFHGLYVNPKTQKALAKEWQVTEKYIQILNKRLVLYLQSILEDNP